MAINFLDNLQLNQNQLLGARLENVTSDPSAGTASGGDIIFNSTSKKLKYFNETSWISLPDGIGIGGSGTSNSVPVFVGTTEIGDSQLQVSGTGGTQTFLFNTNGQVALKGNLVIDNAGIVDVNGSTGVNGYVLFSNGSQVEWAQAPVSYTKWILQEGSNFDIDDGDTLALTIDSAYPGIQFSTSKTGTTVTTFAKFYPKDISTTTGLSDYTADLLIYQDTSDGFKAKKTLTGNIPLSRFGDAIGNINMGANSIINLSNPVLASAAATKAYVDANTGTTYTLPVTSGTNSATATLTGSDGTTSAVQFLGTTNETTVGNLAAGNITIGLPNDVTLAGDLTVNGGDITLGGTGRIQGVDTVSAGTDAVNKTYVDNAIVGNLVFQGGYNASTNTPNLDANPNPNNIKKGWAYVVTVGGSFFTETVEVGDFLFAQSDAPTALGDWVTVQNNVGLATISSVGIGNVIPSTDSASLGVNVSYTNGTASVGWAIKSLSTISNAIVDADFMAILDQSTNEQKRITLNTLKTYFQEGAGFAGTSASGTTHTFNHNLGTYDVIVQTYDASNYETVYAKVDRTSVNQVVVTTAASANIRCLINTAG